LEDLNEIHLRLHKPSYKADTLLKGLKPPLSEDGVTARLMPGGVPTRFPAPRPDQHHWPGEAFPFREAKNRSSAGLSKPASRARSIRSGRLFALAINDCSRRQRAI